MSSGDSWLMKIRSSKFPYFVEPSRGQIPSINNFCMTFSFGAFYSFCFEAAAVVYLAHWYQWSEKKVNFSRNKMKKINKKKNALLCGKTNLHSLYVRLWERARAHCYSMCVWLKSSEFPLISWTSCASMCIVCTLSSAFSAIQSTTVRAPVASSCTSCSVHSSHNDDFHCVHGKLHRINFSSRRLVFPKFIFFSLLHLSLEFLYRLWAELNSVVSHFCVFFIFRSSIFLVIFPFSLFIHFLLLANL